jgi:membrane protein YdbS with pleckstrin-like domain
MVGGGGAEILILTTHLPAWHVRFRAPFSRLAQCDVQKGPMTQKKIFMTFRLLLATSANDISSTATIQ